MTTRSIADGHLATTTAGVPAPPVLDFDKLLAKLNSVGQEVKNVCLVGEYVTAGAGTKASPYTGWDTAIADWSVAGTEYRFSGHYYSYTTPPSFGGRNVTVRGGPGTVLVFAKTGGGAYSGSNGLTALNVVCPANVTSNFVMDQITLDANGADIGIAADYLDGGDFRNVTICNARLKAWKVTACYLVNWITPVVGQDSAPGLVTQIVNAATAMYFDVHPATTDACTYSTILNANFDHLTGDGIVIHYAKGIQFINGASEQCGGAGLVIDSTASNCIAHGLDLEVNTGKTISGHAHAFVIHGNGNRIIHPSAGTQNYFVDGIGNTIDCLGADIEAMTPFDNGSYNVHIGNNPPDASSTGLDTAVRLSERWVADDSSIVRQDYPLRGQNACQTIPCVAADPALVVTPNLVFGNIIRLVISASGTFKYTQVSYPTNGGIPVGTPLTVIWENTSAFATYAFTTTHFRRNGSAFDLPGAGVVIPAGKRFVAEFRKSSEGYQYWDLVNGSLEA